MPIVNSKLGNGFVVRSMDSVEDQEHYFGGAKCHVTLVSRGMPDSSVDINTSAYYHLDGESETIIDESSGVNVLDSSIHNAHASGANVTFGITEYLGVSQKYSESVLVNRYSGSINLSSSLQYIHLGSNDLASGTIEFWFRAVDSGVWSSGSAQVMMDLRTQAASDLALIQFNDSDELAFGMKTDGGDINTFAVSWDGGTDWHHYAMTWDRNNTYMSGFVDGVSVGSVTVATASWSSAARTFLIGSGTTQNGLNGLYDEVRVSSVVRDIPNTWKTYGGKEFEVDSSEFVLTGAEGIELNGILFDANNVRIDTSGFIQSVFGLSATQAQEKFSPKLSLKLSASNTVFNSGDITASFKDDNSNTWSSYKDVKPFGRFAEQDDGFYKFEAILQVHERPVVSFDMTNVQWLISSSGNNIYVFKDVKLEFDQDLSTTGVERYQKLDNQNIEKKYINRNVMPKVE